jgi:hypothetical protein
MEVNRDDYLQYLHFTNRALRKKIHFIIDLSKPEQWIDDFEDSYCQHPIGDDFLYLLNSEFYNFFSDNNIDVPACFKKNKSVKRPIHQLELLRFNNYMMSSGLRYKSFKYLIDVILSVQNTIFKSDNSLFNSTRN